MEEDFSWLYPPKISNKTIRNKRNSRQKRDLKQQLAEKYGWKCKLCGRRLNIKNSTLDHILRVRDGGDWKIANLRLSCRLCNEERS